jgi:hypothetical protein
VALFSAVAFCDTRVPEMDSFSAQEKNRKAELNEIGCSHPAKFLELPLLSFRTGTHKGKWKLFPIPATLLKDQRMFREGYVPKL